MARTKKKEVEEEINVEDLDFSEYGVTTDEYLNISVINQKVNLKKLKRRLKNITESMAVTETSLVQLICVLENCYTAKKISLLNQEKIVILLKNFDDSLIDIVWNIDNIIDDADYGTLFEADCEMAEQKIIEIVEITKEIEDLFVKVRVVEEFEKSISSVSLSIMEILECSNQIRFLFQKINNIHDAL